MRIDPHTEYTGIDIEKLGEHMYLLDFVIFFDFVFVL